MARRRELGDVAVLVVRREAREAADLAEGAGIEQHVDALAAGELAAVALAHHAGIVRAGREALVGDRLQGRDLGQHRRPAFVCRHRRDGLGGAGRRLDHGEDLAAIDGVAHRQRRQRGDGAGAGRRDGGLHLHGADDEQQVARFHLGAFASLDVDDRSRMRAFDGLVPGRHRQGTGGGAPAPRPRPRLATCWSRNCSAPVFAFAGSIASASSVVRALPARNSGCARIARSWSPLVGTPTMWNSSSARRVRSTAESKQPEEPDWQISLASRGSNCGGGASPT